MEEAGCEDGFRICGVGILEGYRPAFARRSKEMGRDVLEVENLKIELYKKPVIVIKNLEPNILGFDKRDVLKRASNVFR